MYHKFFSPGQDDEDDDEGVGGTEKIVELTININGFWCRWRIVLGDDESDESYTKTEKLQSETHHWRWRAFSRSQYSTLRL